MAILSKNEAPQYGNLDHLRLRSQAMLEGCIPPSEIRPVMLFRETISCLTLILAFQQHQVGFLGLQLASCKSKFISRDIQEALPNSSTLFYIQKPVYSSCGN